MMNFVEEEKGFCDMEEQEGKEVIREATGKLPFASSSSPSGSSKYRNFLPQHQKLWLDEYKNEESGFNFEKKLELMDLSLGNSNETSNTGGSGGGGSVEMEHMFDKVVTPSDVGKLNRLVIPKQHAEKYFPLDSSSNEKGLLLNFEDRNGKPWRFRYSYWNSSQSYVMTKGWSRFVKEKKLDAGDIVSFQRGVGELGKDRLYIDWRRRPEAPDPSSLSHFQLQNQLHFPQSVRWGRLYSLPQSVSMSLPPHYEHLQRMNYGILPYQHHHHHHHHHNYQHHLQQHQQQPQRQQQLQQQQQQVIGYGSAAHYYLSPSSSGSHHHEIGSVQQGGEVPMVIDSVPVVQGKTAAKRLRLFGVNMEYCATTGESSSIIPPHGAMGSHISPHLPAPSLPSVQLRLPNNASLPTLQADQSSNKGKSSLSFDLDL